MHPLRTGAQAGVVPHPLKRRSAARWDGRGGRGRQAAETSATPRHPSPRPPRLRTAGRTKGCCRHRKEAPTKAASACWRVRRRGWARRQIKPAGMGAAAVGRAPIATAAHDRLNACMHNAAAAGPVSRSAISSSQRRAGQETDRHAGRVRSAGAAGVQAGRRRPSPHPRRPQIHSAGHPAAAIRPSACAAQRPVWLAGWLGTPSPSMCKRGVERCAQRQRPPPGARKRSTRPQAAAGWTARLPLRRAIIAATHQHACRLQTQKEAVSACTAPRRQGRGVRGRRPAAPRARRAGAGSQLARRAQGAHGGPSPSQIANMI
jgi:hypothetical protein